MCVKFSVADIRGNQNFVPFCFGNYVSSNVLTPVDASFQTFENIQECGLKKKLSKIKTSICPKVYYISVCDMRRQPGKIGDPLTRTSWTDKARANEARHKHPRLHESIQGSVSIYILALVLSGVLSARVYSQHNICQVLIEILHFWIF